MHSEARAAGQRQDRAVDRRMRQPAPRKEELCSPVGGPRRSTGDRWVFAIATCAACGLLGLLSLPARAGEHPTLIDQIVATVDSQPILLSQWASRAQLEGVPAHAEGPQTPTDPVLDRIIGDALVAREAARRDIRVDGAEVEKAVADAAERSGRSVPALVEALHALGVDEDGYRAALGSKLLQMKAFSALRMPRLSGPPEGTPRDAWWEAEMRAWQEELLQTATVTRLVTAVPVPVEAGQDAPCGAGPASDAEADRVTRVVLRGLRRTAPSAVCPLLQTRSGAPLRADEVRDDILRVWRQGQVDSVRVSTVQAPGGLTVVFEMTERPLIAGARIDGVPEPLRAAAEAELRPLKGPLDPAVLGGRVAAIRERLRSDGYLSAKVVSEVERRDDERVDVVIAATPGPQARLASVEIIGLETMPLAKALRAFDRTPDGSSLTESPWRPLEAEQGLIRLHAALLDRGLVKARVKQHEVTASPDGKTVSLRVRVQEGPICLVGTITVVGDLAAEEGRYQELVTMKPGSPLVPSALRSIVQAMEDLHRSLGRVDLEVETEVRENPDTQRFDVELRVRAPGK